MTDGPLEAAARLEEAVEAYFRDLGDPSLVLDWVLTVHRVDAQDHTITDCLRPDAQPPYRALGLLRYGAIQLADELAEAGKETDEDHAEQVPR